MFRFIRNFSTHYKSRIFSNESRKLIFKIVGCSIGISSTYFLMNQKSMRNKIELRNNFFAQCDSLLSIPYVIIGSGTAAYYAAKKILENDKNAKILLISEQQYPFSFDSSDCNAFCKSELLNAIKEEQEYVPATISFPILENIVAARDLMQTTSPSLSVYINTKVESIDTDTKELTLDGGDRVGFNKLIIATELKAKPHKIFDNISNEVKNRVLFMNSLGSYEDLIKILKEGDKKIAIVGSTSSAYTLACALAALNKNKTPLFCINEQQEHSFMSILPKFQKELLVNHLRKKVKNLYSGVEIENIQKNEQGVEIKMKNENNIIADYVVVFNETEPDTKYNQGVHCHGSTCPEPLSYLNGGYEVDDKLCSLKNKDILIAGDNAVYSEPIFNIKHFCPGFVHSFYTAQAAGRNATGLNEVYDYMPVQNFVLADNIKYMAVGLTDPALETVTCAPIPTDWKSSVYKKSAIFYHKDEKIVGVVSWNLFRNIGICEEIISSGYHISQAEDICKFFFPHSNINPESSPTLTPMQPSTSDNLS